MLSLLTCKKKTPPVQAAALQSPMPTAVETPHLRQGPTEGKAMKFRFGNGDQPLPGFTIKRGVGVGGFGEVYFATNDAGKEVALKQIQRNLEVEVRGVRQCLNLKHPNLVSLYDIQFDAQEQGWIVMEYVAGPSLRDALDAHPQGLPGPELQRWFGQLVAGVTYLHDHGIVHRDLKPANLFDDEGIVKIGDYGLSKFISCSRRGGQTESVGTFHYMAPEIGKGEYGKEIDIYALGIILYEMATGVVPFDGESSQEIIMKHLTTLPNLNSVASPLREVIEQALVKNPATRTHDARTMLHPLGLDLDSRYMLVTKTTRTPPVVDAAQAHSGYAAARQQPQPQQPQPQQPQPQQPQPQRAQFQQNQPEVATAHYQEPIAHAVRQGWLGLNQWWTQLRINPGFKVAILVVAIIFSIEIAGLLLSLLVMGLMLYVPYYVVWWTLRSPAPSARQRGQHAIGMPGRHAPVGHGTQPTHYWQPVATAENNQPAAANSNLNPPVVQSRLLAMERPLSVKQWRVAKRQQLIQTPRLQVCREVTGGWLGSAAVIAVFSTLAALFQIGSGQAVQPLLVGTVWAALVALTVAWVAIAFGKRWQREEGDWAIRAFMQLTSGFAIGLLAYGLAQFLMVPWESITRGQLGELPVHRWRGFFSPDGQPLLPAYLAYFPLLMGLVGWWKQVDPLRRIRFSFWSVMWCVLAASLVHLLIPFPQPWGALIAAGASLAIQLSSPWVNPSERLHMRVPAGANPIV